MKFWGFVLASLFSVTVLARPEIVVPEFVEISHRTQLHLGDIVELTETPMRVQNFLNGVVIHENAKELLLSQRLQSHQVLAAIRKAMLENSDLKNLNPLIRVPSEVQVEFSKSAISEKEVKRKIENFLGADCSGCEYNVGVQSVPVPDSLNWTMDYSQISTKGGFLIPLRDKHSGSVKWISGTIKVKKLTPTAKRLILQGERLQASDIHYEMKDVTFQEGSDLKIEEIVGQVLSRNISRGTIIHAKDLRREPAAKRGQIVKALWGDEGFEISLNMQAEDNGQVGDVIKVRHLENAKIFSGTIVEKGVVKLQ